MAPNSPSKCKHILHGVTRQYDTISKSCATLNPTIITWHYRGQAITISLHGILWSLSVDDAT
jgi:hypothetical protein